MSRYTQNLYDVGSFFDRNIPTRNEFFGMVGSPKAPVPESMSYEQRLKNIFPAGERAAPTSVQDKIQAHAQSVADLQKRLALMKEAGQYRTPEKDAYIGDKNMQPGWDEIPKGTSFLPAGAPDELFRFTKNPELFNHENQQPQQSPVRAPAMDGYARDNLRAEAAQMAAAPSLETQIQNINNQTVQAATGKQQEAGTMSDLQKMAQAYFGGRTKEQRQHEAFMNIAAGLAAGKSPNFMDNLGGAVSGAITYDRDDTNRREKEALEGFIKIQGQDDTRLNNQMENEIRRESNDIAWANNDVSRINATRERSNDGARFRALNTEASNLRAIMKAEEAKGADTSPYKLRLESIAAEMFQLNGGQLPPNPLAASEASSGSSPSGWSVKRIEPKG